MRVSLRDGLPVRIEHEGRIRVVASVLDVWRVGNRWWRGEAPSTHYLVDLTDQATVEILEQTGTWHWVRVMD